MEETKVTEKPTEKKQPAVKKKNVLKKLDIDAAKLLQSLKDKANKKSNCRQKIQ